MTEQNGKGYIVRLVNKTIISGIREGVSQIRICPTKKHVKVKYIYKKNTKIVAQYPLELLPDIIARIKEMAGLNNSVHDRAQEGSMHSTSGRVRLYVGVGIVPTDRGESAVLILPIVTNDEGST